MNEIVVAEDVRIEDMIHVIRGLQVILDRDLARIYKCVNGTKDINKAVKRNIEKFPSDFMFQLTNDEYNSLRFQFGTSNEKGGRRYNPYCFTEYGVIALAGILHSEIAIEMSVKITRIFVAMKKYISNNLLEQKFINEMVIKDNKRLDLIEKTLEGLKKK